MRAHRSIFSAALAATIGSCLLSACGSKTVLTKPDATAASTGTVASSSTAPATTTTTSTTPATTATTVKPTTTLAPTTTTTVPAAVGSTVTLAASQNKLAITVADFRDPVETSGFSKPDAGKHYVGVKLRVLNAGTKVWDDSISNGAKLVDDKRQEYRSTYASSTGLAEFRSATVAPGDTRLGWVMFQVPDGTVLVRFTLALDSGFANQVGQWLLGSGAAIDPAPPVKMPEAGPGVAITLKGHTDTMAVTLKAVVDPAQPSSKYTKVPDGMRLVAVQFEFANAGSSVYDDSPTNGMTLVDALGQMWGSTYSDVTAGPGFEGGLTIPPADSRLGWVVFEIPADVQTVKVQVVLDSGFADQAGEWKLT